MDFLNDLDDFEMVDEMDDWMPLEHQMAFHWRDIGLLDKFGIFSKLLEFFLKVFEFFFENF